MFLEKSAVSGSKAVRNYHMCYVIKGLRRLRGIDSDTNGAYFHNTNNFPRLQTESQYKDIPPLNVSQ